MAKKRRRRGLGNTGLKSHGEKVCAQHFKGHPDKIAVCQQTVRGMVKKMVANRQNICESWCGCP